MHNKEVINFINNIEHGFGIRYIKTADLVVTVVNTLIGSHCATGCIFWRGWQTRGLSPVQHTLAVPLYILGMRMYKMYIMTVSNKPYVAGPGWVPIL